MTEAKKLAIISGGSATNELVGLYQLLSSNLTYILPISDNGGSTSELLRVIGGPAIGDIRSRLTRLIPEQHSSIKRLLSFRLSSDSTIAKSEWNCIVDGTHELWEDFDSALKEIVRSFFIHVHMELLKRSRNSTKNFRFELASIGNLFLTGIRLFCGSLDSAIEMVLRITRVDENIKVLPCLNTNFSYHISALLDDGLIITGQSQISHPTANDSLYPPPIDRTRPSTPTMDENYLYDYKDTVDVEDANPQYTHPDLKKSQLHFSKDENIPLISPIRRIFYISPYGEEIHPKAHSRVLNSLSNADAIIYSIGSLMTSTAPVLILKGVGKAISTKINKKKKILLLNGCNDRETNGMSAMDFLKVIIDSALYSLREPLEKENQDSLSAAVTKDTIPTAKPEETPIDESIKDVQWTKFVTHLFFPTNSLIPVDIESIESHGVKCVEVKAENTLYDLQDLKDKLQVVI